MSSERPITSHDSNKKKTNSEKLGGAYRSCYVFGRADRYKLNNSESLSGTTTRNTLTHILKKKKNTNEMKSKEHQPTVL